MRLSDDLRDDEARTRIRTDTRATLFVDAGAGSGKTQALVTRVQTLVVEDGIPIGEVAAVTFTERAAAELRDRLRDRFEQAARDESIIDQGRDRAEAALDGLDMAAIGTLHSFAQRILTEHPIEAGIPPLLGVLDEVGSSVAFEARWAQLRSELLDDEGMALTLELAFAVGVTLDHLRSLIARLNGDWDLVRSHVLAASEPEPLELPDVTHLLDEARRLVAVGDHCTDAEDRFLGRLAALSEWVEALDAAGDDPRARASALQAARKLSFTNGRQPNWGGRLPDLRKECEHWRTSVAEVVGAVTTATLRSIVRWCGERVLESADQRRAAGELEFHDLLVLARDVLRENAEVRASLQSRYTRLLLDEFQDTDPIQIEIAVRIAGGAAADADRWEDVEVPPGSIFVVGDPKQSIYRFRRADIGMYLRAKDVLGGRVTLTTNFRTGAPILDWVNAVFEQLIIEDAGKQPAYVALDQHRSVATQGPPVAVLGAEAHDGLKAAEVRELEAQDVARAVVTALEQKWTTEVVVGRDPAGAEITEWRPLRPGDITILVPARTSLPFLEDALDDAQVDYRVQSSSLVYSAQEVRDLFAAARAVADPSDSFALVTALRSPLFGCGDDDLWAWKRNGGSFSLLPPLQEGAVAHPVGDGIRYLQRLHYDARWMTPSEVLGRLTTDRRMFEVAVFSPRARDTWRRLRHVIDQARAWSESEHGGLRAYLAWAAAQSSEGSRVAESVLPETDVDSVRIMTIHAAKGLEFPMVVLSGMSSFPNRGRGVQLLWTDDDFAVKIGSGIETQDFAEQQPLDEQMSDLERMRLLYVAATRARDHLVVSLHRGKASPNPSSWSNSMHLATADAATVADAVQLAWDADVALPPRVREAVTPPVEFERWLEGVRESASASRRVPAISASGLEGTDPDALASAAGTLPASMGEGGGGAPEPAGEEVAAGLAKGARDVENPAWLKGRYGSAVGRAVHGVLQSVDLRTGSGLEDAVAAQCLAEGVADFTELVTALAQSALTHEVVRRAADREHWRESYVGTTEDDGRVLEGFVDLIYREDDGSLVIVDYKTDDIPDAAIPVRTAYYQPQLDAYRRMLSDAVEGTVADPTLVFLHPKGI